MQTWQLQQAKNRFSEVVEKALHQGPQVITRRGTATVVLLSVEEYRRLRRTETDLVSFFRSSPLVGVDLDLERSRETGREIEL
jgi:prevent-host-death family protein